MRFCHARSRYRKQQHRVRRKQSARVTTSRTWSTAKRDKPAEPPLRSAAAAAAAARPAWPAPPPPEHRLAHTEHHTGTHQLQFMTRQANARSTHQPRRGRALPSLPHRAPLRSQQASAAPTPRSPPWPSSRLSNTSGSPSAKRNLPTVPALPSAPACCCCCCGISSCNNRGPPCACAHQDNQNEDEASWREGIEGSLP